MEHERSLSIVQHWQEAANRGDIPCLIELSDANIEIVGPRGTAHGHQVLRDWMGRAGLTLTTLRNFARGNSVVVEQHGEWRSVTTGESEGSHTIASSFRVEDGHVTRLARFDSLDVALADAGLNASDEIPIGT